MKKLIFILVLLASCSNDGVQTVKTIDGLKVKTVTVANTQYPEYEKGDTVTIWRSWMSNEWHISTTSNELFNDSEINREKGVIQ